MMDKKRFSRVLIVFIVLSLIGLLLSLQEHMLSVDSKEKDHVVMSWAEALIYNLGWIYLWGLVSPLVLKLGSRYPLARKNLLRNIAIHAAAATVFTIALVLCLKGMVWMLVKPATGYKMDNSVLGFLWRMLADNYIIGLLIYCIILGIGQVLLFYKKYRERRLRASQLETRLAETELESLKMQLHPSYLFNTLRSISCLIHEDVDSADKMIARLGDFLRFTLDTAGSREVTLQQEIDYLKCYLEIERIRMKNRLNIELVTQPETLDWLVPALVLQPIVESVFEFSTIKGAPEQTLLVETWLDGRGRESIGVRLKGKQYTEKEWSENQELLNAHHRLRQIYGTAYRLEVQRDRTGNLQIRLRFPLLPNPLEKTA